MSRASKGTRKAAKAAAIALALAGPARAQSPVAEPDPAVAQLEDYLGQRGLDSVLAAHLRARLREGTSAERARAAERLGRLYVTMLGQAPDAASRQRVEGQARQMLELAPEVDSLELRISLAKASYLRAEETAERDRIRLASVEDVAEALRVLRGVTPVFAEIASRAHAQVEALEKRERQGTAEGDSLRDELAYARRTRSLAKYYSGWASYYSALLGKNPGAAATAMEEFGWLLNATPGRAATVDRIPKTLLVHEHVARAAVGCALCASLRGNDVEAVRWIDELSTSENLNRRVADQMFARRVEVLAAAQRWADVEGAARRARELEPGKPPAPLPVTEARLLVVVALETVRSTTMRPGLREMAERVAQIGFADLITRGEVGHVLDLVSRYGTTPIGNDGFIAHYVRGLQAYERARDAHKALTPGVKPGDTPATDTAVINQYREAAKMLGLAGQASDVGGFSGELSRVRMRQALAMFYAGDLADAAARFQQAADGAPPALREDALWYAIVALDLAVERGAPSLARERDRVGVLYLSSFPNSPNAARLLLRLSQSELLSDAQTLSILSAVAKDAPTYEAARRQIARILYKLYRRASPTDRVFAATRFLDVADGVLRDQAVRATAGKDTAAQDAAKGVLVLARQVMDAALAQPHPDLPRVQNALDVLSGVAAFHTLDVAPLQPELSFRRLQIAVAKNDAGAVERELALLRRTGGEFAASAERLLYLRAVEAWTAAPEDQEFARRVVRHGLMVLERAAGAGDAALMAVREKVAAGAFAVWRASGGTDMRDKALELDRYSSTHAGKTVPVLRRLAATAESAGAEPEALDAWRELLAGLPAGSPEWFEARYHSLRLLLPVDPAAAAEAMKQHKVLHPDYGPAPWGQKLADLDARISFSAPANTPAPAPASKGGGK